MKKLLIGFVFLALVSCSSSETSPEAVSDTPTDSTSSTESLPAPSVSESAPPATETAATEALSTPVTEPSSSATDSSAFDNLLADGEKPKEEPASSSPPPSSDSLFAPGEAGEAKDATLANTNPEPALPSKENTTDSMSSVAATDSPPPSSELPAPQETKQYNTGSYQETKRVAPPKKLTYEEFRERELARNESEAQMDEVSLYAHEGGKFQFSLDYDYKPFSSYDFDRGAGVQKFESQGGGISATYFPIHELSYGRFGLGLHAAVYWTKFKNGTGPGFLTNGGGLRHSIDLLGAHAVYEFNYSIGQLFAPFATIGYDRVLVRNQPQSNTNNPTVGNGFYTSNYGGGVHLNLNRLESSTAAKGLANVGIRKFYLSYTYLIRNIASKQDINNILGLRFEY